MRGLRVVYDDNCQFCEAAVAFVASRAKSEIEFFPRSAGKPDWYVGRDFDEISEETIVATSGRTHLMRSDAAAACLKRMHGGYPLLGFLVWAAKPISIPAYDWVARNRHKFSKYCT